MPVSTKPFALCSLALRMLTTRLQHHHGRYDIVHARTIASSVSTSAAAGRALSPDVVPSGQGLSRSHRGDGAVPQTG